MPEPRIPDVFARARLRLAVLFAGIVVILVVVSGVFTYLNVRSDLQAATRGDFKAGESEQEFVTRSLSSFRWQLLVVDGMIILAVGVAGLLYARSTLRPIRDSVAAQKRFVADASHDLRTPLAILKTDFQVALRDPELAEEVKPVLRSGLEEVDHMAAIVEDLLTLSRIDAHQEQIAVERFDLAALARQTAQMLEGLAAAGGVTVRAGGADAAPAAGDERHTQRALVNILKNALEHSPPGGTVEVEATVAESVSSVTVTDRGEGIAPAELEHIFDRFYRADPSRSQERGGSGLGLAIARWAVRRMGGDLVAESTVGVGTRMTLTLPAPRS